MLKKLKLLRVSNSDIVTQGVIVDDLTGIPLCLTLEEPWRENKRSISCIPVGVYECEYGQNSKGKGVYHVKDVPGRDFVQIHIGNTTLDIEGCILVGCEFGKYKDLQAVLSSTRAFEKLYGFAKQGKFILEISEVKK